MKKIGDNFVDSLKLSQLATHSSLKILSREKTQLMITMKIKLENAKIPQH